MNRKERFVRKMNGKARYVQNVKERSAQPCLKGLLRLRQKRGGSEHFDRIRILQKGLDLTRSGSATLPVGSYSLQQSYKRLPFVCLLMVSFQLHQASAKINKFQNVF